MKWDFDPEELPAGVEERKREGSSSSRMGCFPEPRKPQLHLSVDQ